MSTNPTVFLSYSSQDRQIVERTAQALRSMSLTPWLDALELTGGDRILDELNEAFATSDYFLVFWSADAAESRWVASELDAAFVRWADERAILIVPVRLDDTELPELMRAISFLDFRGGVDEGLAALRSFFGREGYGPEQPPRRLGGGTSCTERLGTLRNRGLRLLLKERLGLHEVREIWMDTFESRLEDDFPGMPLGLSIGEMILRADERRVRDELLTSICANRRDIGEQLKDTLAGHTREGKSQA